MTKEQMRIAVAEAMGDPEPHWWCETCAREVHPAMVRFNETHDGCGGICRFNDTPDYPNDLNAMREVENAQIKSDPVLMVAYPAMVAKVAKCLIVEWGYADAAQRCEAFLKTKNLWIA